MIKLKNMKKIIILNLLFISSLFSQDYYFEKYAPFDENIKSPEEFLGYPIGEMHTRHDLIVSYMEYLSDVSDKAQILHYGETYEKRKLVILAISSSDKIIDLEKIRQDNPRRRLIKFCSEKCRKEHHRRTSIMKRSGKWLIWNTHKDKKPHFRNEMRVIYNQDKEYREIPFKAKKGKLR